MNNKLTPQQEKFIEEYMLDGNGARAAREAGYNYKDYDSQAWKVMQNKNIKLEIENRRAKFTAELAEKYEIKREYIVEKLLACINECIEKHDRNNLLKSLEILNKMQGNYSTTVRNINVDIPLFPEEPKKLDE